MVSQLNPFKSSNSCFDSGCDYDVMTSSDFVVDAEDKDTLPPIFFQTRGILTVFSLLVLSKSSSHNNYFLCSAHIFTVLIKQDKAQWPIVKREIWLQVMLPLNSKIQIKQLWSGMTSDKAQWPTEPQDFVCENFCLEIGTLCLPSQAAAPSLIMGKNGPTWANW